MTTAGHQTDRRALCDSILLGADGLPFGGPPPGLSPLEDDLASGPDDAFVLVAGLMANAAECSDSERGVLATCLCEAGRTLERRARRPSEAWCCYSRAFLTGSEDGCSLGGLARLSRAARDASSLRRILGVLVEKAADAPSFVALSLEKAAHEIAADEREEALRTLLGAVRKDPGSVRLRLLVLALSAADAGGTELHGTLDALSRTFGQPGLSAAATAACAAIEEGGGLTAEALERLRTAADAGGAPVELLWALARIALRSSDDAAVSKALSELSASCDGELGAAFSRIEAAFHACSGRYDPEVRPAATAFLQDAASPWDLALVDAFRSGDRVLEAGVARASRPFVSSAPLSAGFEECERLAKPRAGEEAPPAPPASATSRGNALARFLSPDDREDDEALLAARGTAPVPALHVALARSRPELAAQILEGMAGSGELSEAAHEIGAARAALLRNALDRPDEALDALMAGSASPAQTPLASLTRLHRRTPDALAAVALAEAEAADGEEARSWCLAWAAHHLVESDRDRAEALFRDALALNPSCGLALHAVERLSGDHATTARSWLAAAASAASDSVRTDDLVKAGVHFALAGDFAGAADAFARGAELARADRTLDAFASRFGLMAAGGGKALRFGSPEGLALDDLVAIASLSLSSEPQVALLCFERLCELLPGDPIAEMGLTEIRYASGRSSEVYGELLSVLKAAGSPGEEAYIYSRLAEIDDYVSSDASSAALSRIELGKRLPLHRPTQTSLVVHFAKRGADTELAEALVGLSRAVEDDADAAAAAATAFRLAPQSLDAARSFAARSPSSIYAAAELEARTEDPQERMACLKRLAEAPQAAAIHVSRLADAFEEWGEIPTALALRESALGINPDSVLDLDGLARLQRVTSHHAGLVDTLRRMAARTGLLERRKEHLVEAARLAAEELRDPELASRLALAAVEVDPSDPAVFATARGLMASNPDLRFADGVLQARIAGSDDNEEKRRLLLEQSSVRERRGDAAGAKESLAAALALFPGDVGTRRALSRFHQRDGEWAEAIAQMFEAARYVQDAATGVELFHELGTLYQDHSDRMDLAEKCFMKVLSWDRGHFASMERLSALYEKTQNWIRKAQALEHLVGMAENPAVKIEKTVALAETLDLHLDRSREAEQMLNEARRTAPLDIRPVEGLAAIYSRQRDSLALNILLDQALTTNAAAIGESPGDAVLYGNLLAILTLKSEGDLAAMAETALSLLGAGIPDRYGTHRAEPWWNIGPRLGEGTVYDFLCPKHVTPGLRETLAAVEEPVAKLLGVGAKNVAASSTRLDRKHPLAQLVAQYASSFAVRGEPPVYAWDGDEIRVAPGSPPAVLVPKPVAASGEEAVHRFAAASALSLLKMGLALGTMLPDEQLSLLIACCIKLSIPSFDLKGVDPGALARELERLRPAIPGKLVERIHPFAFDCSSALEDANLRGAIRTAGQRAGFIAAGTFSSAIEALRVVSGRARAPLGEVPGMGGLASFVFSKVHSELRQRMGI